ncbi:MAG: DUF4349 domain-containing protein [Calditrichaeota bacterium]|nr:DUF4349 domain-containing protein [Calditrichota bacterium]
MKYLILSALFLVIGCGAQDTFRPTAQRPDYSVSARGGRSDDTAIKVTAQRQLIPTAETNEQSDRLVQYRYSLTVETEYPDSVHKQITALVQRYQGYVLYSRNNTITLRIVADKSVDVINDINRISKIIARESYGTDVTEEHYDLNIRLDNAKQARDRYLKLLDIAKTVDEILKIERELERLTTDIDRLEGQLKRLTHLVEFTTITVQINSLSNIKPGPIGYVFYGAYQALKWFFVWD